MIYFKNDCVKVVYLTILLVLLAGCAVDVSAFIKLSRTISICSNRKTIISWTTIMEIIQ